MILGGNLETANRSSSIPFPGDGANVLTLGCVDEQRQRLPYSSCGPNSPRPKPDFVAQVPFPSRFRERPFTGTSAAAPQGAGLAALLLSREPGLSPERVRDMLRGAAVDLQSPGHDAETGARVAAIAVESPFAPRKSVPGESVTSRIKPRGV